MQSYLILQRKHLMNKYIKNINHHSKKISWVKLNISDFRDITEVEKENKNV